MRKLNQNFEISEFLTGEFMPNKIRRRIFQTYPLDEHEDLIFEFRAAGCSYQTIQKALHRRGLPVDRSTLFRYVQSHYRIQ